MNQLHANILGEGKPLCILHGFLGMSDNWKTLGVKYASLGFQVHLIDQRNHGRSFHSSEFDYDLLAEDLHQYLLQKNINKTSLIGHSMGGKTAMQFACSYPEMLDKLIIVDIAPRHYPPHHHDIVEGMLSLDFTKIKSRKDANNQLEKYIPNIGIRQFILKNLYRTNENNFAFRCNINVLANKMEEVGENISGTDSFDGDTLFLAGDKSEYILPTDSTTIQNHFPMAMIETVKNAGHWLHAENPIDFFSISEAFLTK